METRTDEQLAADYLGGDERALEFLIRKYLAEIYNFALSYAKDAAEAEDITQEAFVKLWKNFKKYRPEHRFKSWLFVIAKNTALDHLKKKRPAAFSDLETEEFRFEDLADDKALSPLALIEKREKEKAVSQTLDRLAPAYRSVMDLHYKEGRNLREAAEILKEPLNTVKSKHRRALQLLKKLLS